MKKAERDTERERDGEREMERERERERESWKDEYNIPRMQEYPREITRVELTQIT